MLKQWLIPISNAQEWDIHLAKLPHGPAHTRAYNESIQATSMLPTYLYAAVAPDFIAACPLSVRTKFESNDIVTPYGFGGLIAHGHYPDYLNAFNEFLRTHNFICSYISIHPTLFDRTISLTQQAEPTSPVYCLNLTPDVDTLFANLAKTHRYELRKEMDNNVMLVEDKAMILDGLKSLYRETINRVGASSVYFFNDVTLQRISESDNLIALGAFNNNVLEAMTVTFFNSYIADYFINASTITGRMHTRILLWKTIEYLKNNHVPMFNLGGGIKPDDSLDEFKRRFGGKRETCHAIKKIHDADKYNDLCIKANVINTEVSYFPAYHFKM